MLENKSINENAEAFADSKERRLTSYWKGLKDGYIEGAAQELADYKSAIKELIPIAEDRLFAVPVKSLEGVQEVIERAKKLIKL